MKFQVVVDTNLIVSAFLWGGPPAKLISELLIRGIPMLTTQAMIGELDATLHKPKFDRRFQAKGVTHDDLMDGYHHMTQLVTPAEIPDDSVRDPKDRIILAAAIGGNASHIISGDKDLLIIQQYNEVIILTVVQFLAILNPSEAPQPDEPTTK